MKHLFIDDHEVEAIDNLARKLHQPQKARDNVVIRPEYRWENNSIQMRTTPVWLPDEGVFKAIYLTSAEGLDPEVRTDVTGAPAGVERFACYATSEDGVNWEKPFLGLYEYEAPTWRRTPIGGENNILPSANGMLQGPIYDPHDPDPRRRSKGLRYGESELRSMVSADFLHWEELDVPSLHSHDESHLTYDESRRQYIAAAKRNGPYGRSWQLYTSEDFENWTEHGLIFHADQTDQENGFVRLQQFFDDPDYLSPIFNRPEEWRTDVYNFPIFPYEGLHLAMPVMHHWAGKHPPLYENVDSRKSVELASSRNLVDWERVAGRAPFMEQSPVRDGETYDTGQIVVLNRPVRRNNELWFYYMGLRYRNLSFEDVRNRRYLDASAICLARLRMDGFVSLKGGVEWGSVLTRPVEVSGDTLHVNADSWRGRVLVEVIDAGSGEAIDGYAKDDCVAGMVDSIDERVLWRDGRDLAELRGRTVRLRFHLWQAELYSYWFD